MLQPVINVTGISKHYRIGVLEKEKPDTVIGALTHLVSQPLRNFKRLYNLTNFRQEESEAADIIWALKDISFSVEQGEIVGIIGRNGAGKSTLLKVLARITNPTEGHAEIKGRIASLLEVGTGFHPELTGRENTYLNGTILGMSRREIDGKFDAIVDFSGIEKFIDTPVKRYSSGMKVRLAFSVAAHLDPEILLIDEVLAVGDIEFQQKCLGRMGDIAQSGRTILFVSHNMAAVSNLCDRGIFLDMGKVKTSGPIQDVITAYRTSAIASATVGIENRVDRKGGEKIHFTDILISGTEDFENPLAPASGQPFFIKFKGKANLETSDKDVSFSFKVHDQYGNGLFICQTSTQNMTISDLRSEFCIVCKIPRMPLSPGVYDILAQARIGKEVADQLENAAKFSILEGDFYKSGRRVNAKYTVPFMVDHEWAFL